LTKFKKKCTFLLEGGKNYASSQKNSEKDNSEENNKSKSKKDNEEVRKRYRSANGSAGADRSNAPPALLIKNDNRKK
jgi:hypothetical protein